MSPKTNNLSGFSLLEMIVATGLLGFLVLAAATVVMDLTTRDISSRRRESAKIDGGMAMNIIGADLANTANIQPAEGMLANNDGLYKGLSGLKYDTYTPECKYQVSSTGEEQFSILRLSSLVGGFSTERTLRPWKESLTGPSAVLRITYHGGPGYLYQVDSSGNVTMQNEIYIIDGDNLASRHYRVLSAKHVVTSNDPYTDIPSVPPTIFTYTELTLQLYPLLNSSAQIPGPTNFISGSTVFASKTTIYCVSTKDGVFTARDEGTNKTNAIYDPSKDNLEITKFNVSYLGTKQNAVLNPDSYTLFPDQLVEISCINTAKVILEVSETSPTAKQAPMKFQRQVLLNSLNLRRPAVCQ